MIMQTKKSARICLGPKTFIKTYLFAQSAPDAIDNELVLVDVIFGTYNSYFIDQINAQSFP
jgi:hypothetical protein